MQQNNQTTEWGRAERNRVEAVVETLATLRSSGESVAEVAHDARNMVTALGLYCDLLEEPGVLATPFLHYGNELRLVAAASRRLVEKLVALDTHERPFGLETDPAVESLGKVEGQMEGWTARRQPRATMTSEPGAGQAAAGEASPRDWRPDGRVGSNQGWDLLPALPLDNLAGELLANRNLLAALAGPQNALTVDAEGGALPVRLTTEDLTRVLVNLVRNAAEAMPAGGRIRLGLREHPATHGTAEWVVLTIEDNGPGIPVEALEKIFESGYTTRAGAMRENGGWPASHRGLGLAITRAIVEEAGGSVRAVHGSQAGARIEIELPVRTR